MGVGPLKQADSQDPGINPQLTAAHGEVKLEVTRPASATGQPVRNGVYAMPVDFGTGTRLRLQAQFIAPTASKEMGPGTKWAVALGARTGDEEDFDSEKRAAATLQIREDRVRLNTPGSPQPLEDGDIPLPMRHAIFHPTDPQPFTLELLIDRVKGTGTATLKVGRDDFSRANYQLLQFKADSGPAITAIGPWIAVASGPDLTASVRVRHFRVFTDR